MMPGGKPMDLKWYEKPMRIAALQCNYEEGKNLEVIDKWCKAGFNVEQLFHPTADGYSALFDEKKHGEILADYLKKAKSKGLHIILYLNVHILGHSLVKYKDEWAQRSAKGEFYKLYDTYYACCLNSPWRDYFFSAIDSLEPYDLDGVFLDGPIAQDCFCPGCQTACQRLMGKPLAEMKDLSTFHQRSKDDFLQEAYRRFKAIKPQGVFYMNLPAMHSAASHVSLPKALEYNDLVGTEGGFMFYGPPDNSSMGKPGMAAKLLEAIAPRKPRVIFMAADQKSWSWYLHTPSETKLCIASSVANASNIWYGLHGASKLLDTPGGKAGQEMIKFLADREEYYMATESAARVALLYSVDTEKSYRSRGEASDFYGSSDSHKDFAGNFGEAFQGIYGLLARSSISFDIVTDLNLSAENLKRYQCLIMPTCACLSDQTVSVIREYVKKGGNLIASFESSLYDSEGKKREDFALGDVLGASYTGQMNNYKNFNYFSSAGDHPIFQQIDIPLLPAPSVGLKVKPANSAKVLAQFHAPMAGRYTDLTEPQDPAIVFNRFGQGQSLFFTGTFGEMYFSYTSPEYRRVIVNAVNLFSQSVVEVKGGVGNLELVVRRQGDRLICHLVNYAGIPPRPFEAVASQKDVKLSVNDVAQFTRAHALIADKLLPIQGNSVVLPDLQEYEVVVLET